ncbi:magnesium-translocating P-type ATPase [Dyadobacter sp. MSC1_007]|jgi:Mg2+-importing ATPase|uniref:magnesium-translocating P-type ATPase n=1 Tax=Dyadobacter sp. MSC1_007 TaxID=2909264 RepID=UPI00202EEC33|nr:magnesium-translocating P-type ATPase [Dyadobacter sp. MSC1_007]
MTNRLYHQQPAESAGSLRVLAPENSIHQLPLPELYTQLESSRDGLSMENATLRLRQKKTAEQKTRSGFGKGLEIFLRQFKSPVVLLLVIAILLSAVLGEISDTLIIFCILMASGLLSFWQEWHGGKAVERLQKMIELNTTVLRDNGIRILNTAEIVTGDVVLLKAGDIIPADCRILESDELHVNESALTGESYPAEKTAGIVAGSAPLGKVFNCLWQGTNVVSGTARAIVVNTGSDTVFGQIRMSLSETPETAFEKGIKQFGYFLLQITLTLTIVILAVNVYFGKPLLDSVLFSLALAIGMAPELLPAIMTVAMSSGAARMMKKKVIVKKLSSIFNLGEVTVLCTDKTGTVTEGAVKVGGIVNISGITDQQAMQYAYLNAVMHQGFSNPVDQAISMLPVEANGFLRVNEVPYDFIRKRLSVLVRKGDEYIIISKGSLEGILAVCLTIKNGAGEIQLLDAEKRKKINEQFQAYSSDGYRVLGLASKAFDGDRMCREDEYGMTFLGYILLEDPLKQSSAASIQKLRQMNVSVKIITGDNRFAAMHIAQKLGISKDRILTGEELDTLLPDGLLVRVLKTDVFAEIEPHQKVRIIKALRQAGAVTAYIGDGINDVAAINAADAGISTHNAVDAAKQAADFVLMEKDLSVLADGIQEGRKSFANSMKYIFISTGATFGNMFSVAGASLLLPFLPMLPKQILLTNFITDLPALAIASDHVDGQQLLRPGKWNIKLIVRFMAVFGLHSSLFDFLTFYILYFHLKLTGASFRTGWFAESVATELLILLVVRTRKSFLKSTPGKMLLTIAILSLIFTLWLPGSVLGTELGLVALASGQILLIAGILVVYVITADLLKVWFFRFNRS